MKDHRFYLAPFTFHLSPPFSLNSASCFSIIRERYEPLSRQSHRLGCLGTWACRRLRDLLGRRTNGLNEKPGFRRIGQHDAARKSTKRGSRDRDWIWEAVRHRDSRGTMVERITRIQTGSILDRGSDRSGCLEQFHLGGADSRIGLAFVIYLQFRYAY